MQYVKQFISIKEEKSSNSKPVQMSIETFKGELKSLKNDDECKLKSAKNCKSMVDDSGVKKSKKTPANEITSAKKDKDVIVKAIEEALKTPKNESKCIKNDGISVIIPMETGEKRLVLSKKEQTVNSEPVLKSFESSKDHESNHQPLNVRKTMKNINPNQ